MKYHSLLLSLSLALCFSSCALAQESPIFLKVETPYVAEKKPKFKDKHPKVYGAYRKTRTVCMAVKPIIEVTGNVCQILWLFVGPNK